MMCDTVTFENRYIRKSRRECTLSQSSGWCPTHLCAMLLSIAREAVSLELWQERDDEVVDTLARLSLEG
jgi:hypothetical protein